MNYQAPQIEWKTERETETDGFFSYEANTATHKYRIYYSDTMKSWVCTYYRFSKPETKHKYLPTAQELKEWVETTHYPSALIKAGFKPVSEPLADTLKWFELAVPEPTIENICVQFGCDLEEQSEILRACNQHSLAEQVESYANDFKAKRTWCMNAINCIDKTELLDGLIDRQVTGLGLGYMLKMNMIAAANEVNRSNWSKFENGKPVFDDNGKIKKGANYTPPQLQEFV